MKDTVLTVVLPVSALARLDTLVPVIDEDPYFSIFGRATRMKVLRLSLMLGTDALQADYRDGLGALQGRRAVEQAESQRAAGKEYDPNDYGPPLSFGEYPTGTRRLNLRLPVFLIERLDGLVPCLDGDPVVGVLLPRATRSAALRYALANGLRQLEQKYLADLPGARPHPFADFGLYGEGEPKPAKPDASDG